MKPLAVALVVALVLLLVACTAPRREHYDSRRLRQGYNPCYAWKSWKPGTDPIPAWAVNQKTDPVTGKTQASAAAHTPYDDMSTGITYGFVEVESDPSKWHFACQDRDGATVASNQESVRKTVSLVQRLDPSCPDMAPQKSAKGAFGFTGKTWGPCVSRDNPGLSFAQYVGWTKKCQPWRGYAGDYGFVAPAHF